MKKVFLVLTLVLLAVTVFSTTADADTWCVCYGMVRNGDLVNYPPLAGATCTLVENGWYTTSTSTGNFSINLPGTTLPSGYYHVRVTKAGMTTIEKSFYYDSTNHNGTDVGDFRLHEI